MRVRRLRRAAPFIVLAAAVAASFSWHDPSLTPSPATAGRPQAADSNSFPFDPSVATAPASPGGPAIVTGTGIRKTDKLSPQLDELHRADQVARAAGRAINEHTTDALPDDLKASIDGKDIALDGAGNVQVFVETAGAPANAVPALQALGMQVQRTSDDQHIVQGMLPIAALADAAALAGVTSVRPPERPHLNIGSVTSQGDAIHGASTLRATIGNDGTGVRVGILSDGAQGLALSQASGDLPPDVDTTTCDVIASAPAGEPANTTDAGAGAEATAMAEIVHDLAPGAQIMIGYFGFNVTTATSLDFQAAVTCLQQNNDIVSDDISYYGNGLYDGTSPISTNTSNGLNNVANPVRGYYTSNSNAARVHYQDSFHDSGFTIAAPFPSPDNWRIHQYQANATTTDGGFGFDCSVGATNCGDKVQLAAGGSLSVVLEWNDPFNNSTNDYDLLIRDEFLGAYFVVSGAFQNGPGSDPFEAFSISNTHGVTANFDILIGNYQNAAGPVVFDEFIFCSLCATFPNGARHNFNTRSSSVPNQSDAGGGVMSLGAIDQADPGNDDIEPFSSIGPTNDGRTKPDAAAIDGVSVTGNGGFPPTFFGTSAASPHAAAIAALVLSCRQNLLAGEPGDNPGADRTALRNALLNTALDLGAAGSDNVFGSGRLRATNAAAAAGCVATDSDGDGVLNASDNCQKNRNPGQLNTDAANTGVNRPGADALGDACDGDIDGDGYTDAQETALLPAKNPNIYCDIMRGDVDGDHAVTILDMTVLAGEFLDQVPPAPERHKQDADNAITILDLTKMANLFLLNVSACP